MTQVPTLLNCTDLCFCLRKGSSVLTCCITPRLWQGVCHTAQLSLMHRGTFTAALQEEHHQPGALLPATKAFQQRPLPPALHQVNISPYAVANQLSAPISVSQVRMLASQLGSLVAERHLLVLHSCSLGSSGDGRLLAQLLIELRFQKPWVWIILHEAINSFLCSTEAGMCGFLEVLCYHVLRLEVNVYLKCKERTLTFRELNPNKHSTSEEDKSPFASGLNWCSFF